MKKLITKFLSVLMMLLIGSSLVTNIVFASDANFSIKVIVLPQCMDGRDNDGDTKIDYPQDQDCNSPSDNSEETDGNPGNPSTSMITIYAKTFPYAKVKILKDGQNLLYTRADEDGNIVQNIFGFYFGQYNFGLIAEDKNNFTTNPLTFHIELIPGTVVNVTEVFLPPTISFDSNDNDNIINSRNIKIEGYAISSSKVQITLKHNNQSTILSNITADKDDGSYDYKVDTSKLSLGDYELTSKSIIGSKQTDESKVLKFSVLKKGVEIDNPEIVEDKLKGDLNNDKKVNLVDFSILLFHWLDTNYPAGDFNNDGIVDIKDFSILAYNWTAD